MCRHHVLAHLARITAQRAAEHGALAADTPAGSLDSIFLPEWAREVPPKKAPLIDGAYVAGERRLVTGKDTRPMSLPEKVYFARVLAAFISKKRINGTDTDGAWQDLAFTLAMCDESFPYRSAATLQPLKSTLLKATVDVCTQLYFSSCILY